MRLKRLSLQGYKTFATKTDFVFDDGITAIVGPNGSGKSNIADALRWVLGEQSYSTLRGKRTTDMIFAGSQTRSRAGMAQAILTLDNTEGWLPIEYSELEIGRRAHQSGENEYLVNGQRVRLKDITELLASSGLAERTYTIIGQGLIDQALSLRPEERRALFEEAAGVTHYKHQRAEAVRRLEETQRNLERVHDILSELKPRLGYLRRQASRAQNYEQVAADLRHHLRIWYGYQWDLARSKLRVARQEDADAQMAWEQVRKAILDDQQRLDASRQDISRLQRGMTTRTEEREALREQVEKTRRRVAVDQERQKLVLRQLQEVESELPELTRLQEKARNELGDSLAALEEARALLESRQAGLAAHRAEFEVKRLEIDRQRQQLEALQAKREHAEAKASQLQGKLVQLAEQLEESRARAIPSKEAIDAHNAVEQARSELEQANEALEQLRKDESERRAARAAAAKSLDQARLHLSELEQEAGHLSRRVGELATKRDLLSREVVAGLQLPDDLDIVGRLAELLEVPKAYSTAIEAVLARRLNSWLVRDEESLWGLLASNPGAHLHAAALPDLQALEQPPAPVLPGVIGWASELTGIRPQAAPFRDALLGRVLLVEQPQQAYRAARHLPEGSVAVTPEGFIATAAGPVESPPQGGLEGILGREQEWRQATADLAAVEDQLAGQRQAIAARQNQVAQAAADVSALDLQLSALATEAGIAVQAVSSAQRQVDRVEQAQRFLEQRKEQHRREVAQSEKRLLDLRAELDGAEAHCQVVRLELSQAQETLEALPAVEAPGVEEQLRQQYEAARTILAGRQAVVDSRRATMSQIDDRLGRLSERRERLQRELASLNLEESAARQAAMEAELEAVEERVRPLRQELAAVRASAESLERTLASQQREGHELETRYTRARIALNQRENQLEALGERIRSDLGLVALEYDDEQTSQAPLPLSEVVERLPQVEMLPADIEESIQDYRGRLNRMGAVNPDAPAEFQETLERHDFLEAQVEDLTATQQRLRGVIDELDDLTAVAFAETVNRVNEVFGEVFERLFGGGSAQLVLTDPDDLTISGVDIVARLPRRREQGLALLSGGERSLTASALIFSLLKVAPTPFCVFDEVDAMLDEANVTRFRELLRELSARTQFVVITHNRGTVQVARTVYGVSMGDDSASQVISIRPEDYLSRQGAH